MFMLKRPYFLTQWLCSCFLLTLFLFLGPLEFMEPDLSSLPPPRPMSPEPSDTKRESITEKNRQGEEIIELQFLLMLMKSFWMKGQNDILFCTHCQEDLLFMYDLIFNNCFQNIISSKTNLKKKKKKILWNIIFVLR